MGSRDDIVAKTQEAINRGCLVENGWKDRSEQIEGGAHRPSRQWGFRL